MAKASYLYAFFSARAKVAMLKHRLEERDRRVWDRIFASANRPGGGDGGSPVLGLPYAVDDSDPRARAVREVAATQFLELKQAAAWSRTELLVANIDDHPLPWLGALLAAEGIACWDASPALRGQTGVRHRIDPHDTAKGHAALARSLANGFAGRVDLRRRSPGATVEGEARLRDRAEALRRRTPTP